MATYSKVLLSQSSGGRGILVAATASLGTLIHNTGSSATIQDEIWLYAHNAHTSTVVLTVEWGGNTDPIKLGIPSQSGLTLVIPGLVLTGDGSAARTVRAFAATTNVIIISGYVNRIT